MAYQGQKRALFVLCLALICFCGCNPTGVVTDRPLSDPLTAEADESLYGHWGGVWTIENDAMEVHAFIGPHVVKDNPEGLMEAAMTIIDPLKHGIESSHKAYFTVSKIGKSSYVSFFDDPVGSGPGNHLNLSQPGSYAKQKDLLTRFFVTKYHVDNDTLDIWLVKNQEEVSQIEKALEELKESSQLKANEEAKSLITYDSLVVYLRKNGGDKLFTAKPMTLKRIPPLR